MPLGLRPAQVCRAGIRATSFDSVLSKQPGVGAHQDPSIDRRQNAQDCLVECLIMARCAGLVSTLSNVSVAAVFFARDGYCHFLFDATVEPEQDAEELAMY
jgi:hypothetical protein